MVTSRPTMLRESSERSSASNRIGGAGLTATLTPRSGGTLMPLADAACSCSGAAS